MLEYKGIKKVFEIWYKGLFLHFSHIVRIGKVASRH